MGDDLAAVGIQRRMQLPPTATRSGTALLLQPLVRAGDMTAPDPQSSNVIQKHIVKPAPSRHDIAEPRNTTIANAVLDRLIHKVYRIELSDENLRN